MDVLHPFLQGAVAASVEKVAVEVLNPASTMSPAMQAFTDLLASLRADVASVKAANLDLAARLLTQQQVSQGLAQLVHTIVGGDTLAGSIQGLYTMLQQDIASDATTAADLLAKITEVKQLAQNTANAVLTKADSAALALVKATADAALPLTGGTMTGPLSVMTPAAAANPVQYSSLPFSMSVQQALPLIALGGLYSFTVNVANAKVGQVVVLNMPPALSSNGTNYSAAVTADGVVTVTLKAGLQIAAGTQLFYLRVLR